MDEPIRISPEEVAAAVPPPPAWISPAPPRPAPAVRTSQLAIASLATAVVGIPLVGLLLGPIAIVLGALGIAQIHGRTDRKGMRLAVLGVALGCLEFVAWGIGLYRVLGRFDADPARPVPALLGNAPGPTEVDEAPPPIRRALRANVRVASQSGFASCAGSGIVVARGAERVLVLTNRHVVCPDGTNPGKLSMAFGAGAEVDARLAWLAPVGVDAAILEAPSAAAASIEPVPLGRAGRLHIGDQAFVVGNPLSYEGTYTTGVISSIRSFRVGPRSLRVYQTQAPVNPGNSGGGLYAMDGTLMGVTTWTTEKRVSEGIGFAIALDGILELLEAEDHPVFKELR